MNINQAAEKLVWILNQANTPIHSTDDWGGQIDINLSNGIVIQVIEEEVADKTNILGSISVVPVYHIGIIETISGGHWDPEDHDFVEVDSTPDPFNAAEIVLLLPERWRIHSTLEAIYNRQPILEEV